MPTVPVPEDLEFDLLEELNQPSGGLDASGGQQQVQCTVPRPRIPRPDRRSLKGQATQLRSPRIAEASSEKKANPSDDELPGALESQQTNAAATGQDDELPSVLAPSNTPARRATNELAASKSHDLGEEDVDQLLESGSPAVHSVSESDAAVFDVPMAPAALAACPSQETALPTRHRRWRGLDLLIVIGAAGIAGWIAFPEVYHDTYSSVRSEALQLMAEHSVHFPWSELEPPPSVAPAAQLLAPTQAAVPSKRQNAQHTPPAAKAKAPPLAAQPPGIPWLDALAAKPSECNPTEQQADNLDHNGAVKAARLREQARALIRQGDVAAAYGKLCEATSFDPESHALALETGRTALLARDAVGSARWAERALAIVPSDRRSRELLGDALAWQGETEAAKAEWLLAHNITRPTEKVMSHLYRGAIQQSEKASKRGNHVFAERLLRRALMFEPDSVDAMTRIAESLLEQGKPQTAQRWVEHVLSIDEEHSKAHLVLGDAFAALNDSEAAAHHWQRSLEIEPQSPPARRRLSKLQR